MIFGLYISLRICILIIEEKSKSTHELNANLDLALVLVSWHWSLFNIGMLGYIDRYNRVNCYVGNIHTKLFVSFNIAKSSQ